MKSNANFHQKILARDWDCPTSGGGSRKPVGPYDRKEYMTFTIMNREQGWTVAGALLLVSCLQLFCSSQLYGQQADIDAAAAAKAAAGREALTHAPIHSPGPKAAGTFVTFDAPGAFQGTFPSSISQAGAITGYYYDANFVPHGFLRASNGTFITFDVPDRAESVTWETLKAALDAY